MNSLMPETIAVIGAGQMGNGVAHVSAQAGIPVFLIDVSADAVARGRATIEKNLERQVKKGAIDAAARDAALGRITTGTDIGAVAGATVAIEAATERRDLKFSLFRDLDRLAPAGALLATNTSSISITEIAAQTKRPGDVIGMHFMNPVPIMKLVEIIRGVATSDETLQSVKWIAKKMGKQPVEVNDSPGFVSNRVLMPMINEAIFALHEGVGSVEAIDEVLRSGMNHPMGPLQLADFIGLDVCLAIMNVLYQGFKDPKYRPCPLLQQYVDAGWLGRKSGRGFYIYEQRGVVGDDRH